jgi:hypothetical protein
MFRYPVVYLVLVGWYYTGMIGIKDGTWTFNSGDLVS